MALYNEGVKVDDFWAQDAKHSEAVFKIIAMASGSTALVRIAMQGESMQNFPRFETWSGAFGAAIAFTLMYFIFRYANAALIDPYLAYRKAKGKPVSSVRYWFANILVTLLGMILPMLFIVLNIKL